MSHYLQYIREELMTATASDPAGTKGQLEGMEQFATIETTRHRRKRRTLVDDTTGARLTQHTDPVPANETRACASPRPLIEPLAYMKASWRRALLASPAPERQWLLFCYTSEVSFSDQVTISRYMWDEFQRINTGADLAAKTVGRVRRLVWLAAQDVKHGLNGLDIYSTAQLAKFLDTSERNFNKTMKTHWDTLRLLCFNLDANALMGISYSRKQTKNNFRY